MSIEIKWQRSSMIFVPWPGVDPADLHAQAEGKGERLCCGAWNGAWSFGPKPTRSASGTDRTDHEQRSYHRGDRSIFHAADRGQAFARMRVGRHRLDQSKADPTRHQSAVSASQTNSRLCLCGTAQCRLYLIGRVGHRAKPHACGIEHGIRDRRRDYRC